MSLIIKKIIMYLVLIALVVYEIWAWFRDVRNWKKNGKQYFIASVGIRIPSSIGIALLVIYAVLGITKGNIPALKNLGIASAVFISVSLVGSLAALIVAAYNYHKEKKEKS